MGNMCLPLHCLGRDLGVKVLLLHTHVSTSLNYKKWFHSFVGEGLFCFHIEQFETGFSIQSSSFLLHAFQATEEDKAFVDQPLTENLMAISCPLFNFCLLNCIIKIN